MLQSDAGAAERFLAEAVLFFFFFFLFLTVARVVKKGFYRLLFGVWRLD